MNRADLVILLAILACPKCKGELTKPADGEGLDAHPMLRTLVARAFRLVRRAAHHEAAGGQGDHRRCLAAVLQGVLDD